MPQDDSEARWENDGGALERQEVEREQARSGVIVVVALILFGFGLAIGMARLLGKRL
jgi:hypothetical protein